MPSKINIIKKDTKTFYNGDLYINKSYKTIVVCSRNTVPNYDNKIFEGIPIHTENPHIILFQPMMCDKGHFEPFQDQLIFSNEDSIL